jgi:tetratricopeptide (TPR) repeat protein
MNAFHEANVLYINEDFQSALALYNESLKEDPTLSLAYLHRGSANLKLKHYTEAIEDFDVCLNLQLNLETTFFRKGLAYFELEKYDLAKDSFENGLKIAKNSGNDISVQYSRYIRKCDAEINDESFQIEK